MSKEGGKFRVVWEDGTVVNVFANNYVAAMWKAAAKARKPYKDIDSSTLIPVRRRR